MRNPKLERELKKELPASSGLIRNPNQNERLLRFLSATAEQQEAIDRILEGRLAPQPPAPTGPLLLRIKDAAALLGVHRTTMWRLVRAGRLETVELLGSLRVRRADVEALAGGHQAAGHQGTGQRAASDGVGGREAA